MKISVNHDPFVILMEDVFEPETADKILDEIIKNEPHYQNAQVSMRGTDQVVPKIRSNRVAYFDDLYGKDRSKSILLSETQNLITSQKFLDLFNSAPFPFSNYIYTDRHETQISRYGDSKEKYDWHIDRIGSDSLRIITISMYMYREPKQFRGGEIILTNGLFAENKIYGETNRLTLNPKPNSCAIFSSRTPHCVMPTESPTEFGAGRFSIQMWLGKNPLTDQMMLELAKAIRSGLS